MVVKKGIYMDGHEQADVVDYWQNHFLPTMAEFKRQMAWYEGPDLRHVEASTRLETLNNKEVTGAKYLYYREKIERSIGEVRM